MTRLNLVLFFTRGMSLEAWAKVGMLRRELAVYLRLQKEGVQVSFVTYGGPDDLKYQGQAAGIRILCNRWNLPQFLYERLIPILHARTLREADILKTNQTNGAEITLDSARFWHKPIIARCGYMWSENAEREYGRGSRVTARALSVENRVFMAASRVVVTTPAMAEAVRRRLPAATERVKVIPNYVDTDLFAPSRNEAPEFDLVFVGRLNVEKNLTALLDAIQSPPVRLLLIGNGNLRSEVHGYTERLNGRIEWLPQVPNEQLPIQLHRARIFILPSFYEGHPKALLEAMSCGLPVIGGNSPGIRELIKHNDTGWLCETDSTGIRAAINRLIQDPELCKRLGIRAREAVLKDFSLDHIAQREQALYAEMLGESPLAPR